MNWPNWKKITSVFEAVTRGYLCENEEITPKFDFFLYFSQLKMAILAYTVPTFLAKTQTSAQERDGQTFDCV